MVVRCTLGEFGYFVSVDLPNTGEPPKRINAKKIHCDKLEVTRSRKLELFPCSKMLEITICKFSFLVSTMHNFIKQCSHSSHLFTVSILVNKTIPFYASYLVYAKYILCSIKYISHKLSDRFNHFPCSIVA